MNLPMNNDHLSTTVPNLGSRGLPLYLGFVHIFSENSYKVAKFLENQIRSLQSSKHFF
jgi:hypothetical protein